MSGIIRAVTIFVFFSNFIAFGQDSLECKYSTDSTGVIFVEAPEVEPQFPGGAKAMMEYIRNKLVFPSTCEHFAGTFYISFIIQSDGGITNVSVINSNLDSRFSEMLITLVANMPKWTPGKCQDQMVPVRYILPININ